MSWISCIINSRWSLEEDEISIVDRTDTFEHTISGLLGKRAELFLEAERIRDRLAEIKNDIGALDRTLDVLGYKGDLDAAPEAGSYLW